MNPVPRQCCDLGESGEAAVGPGQPRKPLLQVFPIERRSRASTSPAGRTRRSPGEVAFSSQGGELLWAVAEARGRVDPAATKPRRRRFRCSLPESSANPKNGQARPHPITLNTSRAEARGRMNPALPKPRRRRLGRVLPATATSPKSRHTGMSPAAIFSGCCPWCEVPASLVVAGSFLFADSQSRGRIPPEEALDLVPGKAGDFGRELHG